MKNSLVFQTSLALDDPEYSDIKFTFGEDKSKRFIHAHVIVIRIKCPKLYQETRTDGSCTNETVTIAIVGVKIEVFMEFLKFIYFGKCDQHCTHSEDLLSLSEKYELPDLKTYVTECFKTLTPNNVIGIYEQSLKFQFEDTRTKCLSYMNNNFSDVLKSDTLVASDMKSFEELLKMDMVCEKFTSEVEVFDAVMRYFMDNEEDNMTIKKLIRFPSMTNEQFVKCISGSNHGRFLSEAEITAIFIEIGGGPKNAFGFSNIMRTAEKQTPYSNQSLDKIIYVASENYNTKTGFPDAINSLFQVNKSCAMFGVYLFKGKLKNVLGGTVLLKNKHGQILSRGRVENAEKNDSTSSFLVELLPLIELKPLKDYILDIKYDEHEKMIEFTYHQFKINPTMPNTVTWVDGGINLNFKSLNSMIIACKMRKF